MSQELLTQVEGAFGDKIDSAFLTKDKRVTIEVSQQHFISVMQKLYGDPQFNFNKLVDIVGIDYSAYGQEEWRTVEPTFSGYSRGKAAHSNKNNKYSEKPRFAVLYNLLSLKHNRRVRVRVFLDDTQLTVSSVCSIWNSANWPEREVFDLFGIIFEGHPDLRRILTDYGFVGHPFRKDFPLIGEVELRYDAGQQRCVYEAVSIQPRVTGPRVIRHDNRYVSEEHQERESER